MQLSDLSISAKELYFYAKHDSNVYKAWMLPAFRNLQRKYKKGQFTYDKGIKLLQTYALVSVAKDYRQQYGGMRQPWQELFPISDRASVAELILDELIAEFQVGRPCKSWQAFQAFLA
jgi:hypothetical protein